jgi:hypothetical protein
VEGIDPTNDKTAARLEQIETGSDRTEARRDRLELTSDEAEMTSDCVEVMSDGSGRGATPFDATTAETPKVRPRTDP